MFGLKRRPWLKPLKEHGSWNGMIDWLKKFDTLSDAWSSCVRGDWMLEILASSLDGFATTDGYSSIFHNKRQISVSCRCARHLLQYVPALTPAEDIIDAVAKWATSDDDSIDISDILHMGGGYGVIHDLSSLAHGCRSGDLFLSCAGISYIICSNPLDFKQSDAIKYRLLQECSDIIRVEYPAPPIMTWKELEVWQGNLPVDKRWQI